MNKKWFAAIGLAGVCVLAFGLIGSGAWFTDKAVAQDNTLTAGTIDLQVNEIDDVTQVYSVSNLRPGSWDLAGQVVLKNTGSLAGHLWLEVADLQNQENACSDPEVKAGDTSCDPLGGELGQFVKPSFQLNMAPWTRYGGNSTLNDSVGQRVDVMDLQPGQSIPLVLYATWHDSTELDNLAQGDGATFSVVFHLDQIPD